MSEKGVCYNCFSKLPESAAKSCPHCGYDPSQDEGKFPLALPHGTVLNGRYITGRVLGQGGFGVTYLANEWKKGRRVAVKEFLPDTMATRTGTINVTAYSGERGDSFLYGRECFLKEAQTLAEFIGNNNIVRVHSYFEENGTAYFVMDYIEGISFQSYIKNHGGKIPWQEAEKILLPVMDALEAVHSRGIVHRDVTPDNIYITDDGTVKLIDFGAARYSLGDRSRSLDVVLKHGFAPKEQYTRRGRQGPYTDVYTVAASFYYAVTGKKPPDSIERLDEDDLVPPSSLGIDMPSSIENAILKGMEVQAADRYQSMAEFKAALRQGVEEEAKREPLPPLGVVGQDANANLSGREQSAQTEDKPRETRQDANVSLSGREQSVQTEDNHQQIGQPSSSENTGRKFFLAGAAVLVLLFLAGMLITVAIKMSEPEETVGKSSGAVVEVDDSRKETREPILSDEPTATPMPSQPAAKVKVPSVKNLPKEEAVKKIQDAGLKAGVTTAYSDSVKSGRVIKQTPGENTEVVKNTEITLVVSSGVEQVTVPETRGVSEAKAKKLLKKAKLKWKVKSVYSSSVTRGNVIKQSKKAGTKVKKNTVITLTVSLGKKPVSATPAPVSKPKKPKAPAKPKATKKPKVDIDASWW